MNCKERFLKHQHSFVDILKRAKEWFEALSQEEQDHLKATLEHGAANLTSKSQLNAYMHLYGEIHRQKLLLAYKYLPAKIWNEDCISVVDYGCGQGIAEMVLSDFQSDNALKNAFVKDFTMIELSAANLKQALEYIDNFFPGSSIIPIQKSADEITADDIKPKCPTVIHVLSNVIDLESFSGKEIAEILSRDKTHNNVVICISPYYQEEGRAQRMHQFGKSLRGYSMTYKLEKHTDDWNNQFSCQLHIYTSLYY